MVALSGCIPVRMQVRPAVRGIVLDGQQPAAGVPLKLSEERGDSTCTQVAARATTDTAGAFAFPGRRAWGVLPLLGIVDARFTLHICGGNPAQHGYTGTYFGGPAAPPSDSVRCGAVGVIADSTRFVRCERAGPAGGQPRDQASFHERVVST